MVRVTQRVALGAVLLLSGAAGCHRSGDTTAAPAPGGLRAGSATNSVAKSGAKPGTAGATLDVNPDFQAPAIGSKAGGQ